jgi:hypothetical protein
MREADVHSAASNPATANVNMRSSIASASPLGVIPRDERFKECVQLCGTKMPFTTFVTPAACCTISAAFRFSIVSSVISAYRLKDFAAFYLSRITRIELPWEPNLAQRDAAIAARLRQQLPR